MLKLIAIISLVLSLMRSPVSYERSAVVVYVDYTADAVTVLDDSGELWQFLGAEDWQVWDRCQLTMHDNGTPGNVYDDMIIGATYTGDLSWEEIRGMII